ncbi:PKAR, partial [Symbiodinium sp. KB8]
AGHLPDSGLGDGERLRAGLHGHALRLPESRNLHAVRDEKTTPQVVLYQFDSSDPMNPLGLLIAYAESSVKPVVSDFDTFTVGSKGFRYAGFPEKQIELIHWSLKHTKRLLEAPDHKGWTSRWLEVLKQEANQGFHPNVPKFGFGDDVSCSLVEDVVHETNACGAVRHGAECFNFYFPQELDQEFLIVWDGFKDPPWRNVSELELRDFLKKRVDDGYTFPFNPVWPIRDSGWYEVVQKLRATSEGKATLESWYPAKTGILDEIDRIHDRDVVLYQALYAFPGPDAGDPLFGEDRRESVAGLPTPLPLKKGHPPPDDQSLQLQDPTAQDENTLDFAITLEHRWLVRPDDWNGGTIPPTVLYSPEDLSRQLDHKDDGTPFVAQVDTEQHAVDCLNMLAGALDGQGTIVLTNVCAKDVDGFGEELRSWATSAQRTTVFGKLGVQISGRMCWLIGFGESPPQMRSKVASPFKPIALDRESVIGGASGEGKRRRMQTHIWDYAARVRRETNFGAVRGFADLTITGRSHRRQHVMFFIATRSDDQQAVKAIIDMGDHKLEVQAIPEARRKAHTRETRALQPERRISFGASPSTDDPLGEELRDDSFECWNPCDVDFDMDEDYQMNDSKGEDGTMVRKRTKDAVEVATTTAQQGKNASKQARKEHWIPRGTIVSTEMEEIWIGQGRPDDRGKRRPDTTTFYSYVERHRHPKGHIWVINELPMMKLVAERETDTRFFEEVARLRVNVCTGQAISVNDTGLRWPPFMDGFTVTSVNGLFDQEIDLNVPSTSEQVAQRFHNVWDLNKYSGLLASDCMTAAWDYLSDMGEKALGAQELSSITWRGGENTQELCDTIQQLVEKREAEEKDSRINQWKAKMEHGGKACTTYKADSLLLLPLDWWEAFTSLWRQLLDGKGVPKQWRGTYVHLLEKNESNDTRPIGLTSLGWRIGSKWLVGALRELADSWLDATVSGGVHGSSVMDTHQYITHVNNCEAVFISQDLSQFFDTISHELLSEFSFTFGCQRRQSSAAAEIVEATGYTLKAKLRGQLHAIAQLPISQTRRRALVMQLATPMFTWAAGMVKWDAAVLSNLRADVCRAIQGPGLVDTPHPIALEMVGWSFEPVGAMMEAIMKAAIRCQARRPRWADEIAMDLHCRNGLRLMIVGVLGSLNLGQTGSECFETGCMITCAANRDHLGAPGNRLEERMLGKLRIEKPPPPPVVDFAGAIDEMAELTVKSMHQQHHVFVATDGSADKDVSALAVVFPACDGEVATGVPSEDQGAFRAEVEAIHAAVLSAVLACQRSARAECLTVVSDCGAALAIAAGSLGEVPVLARRVHAAIRRLRVFMRVDFHWVPSHGKQNNRFVDVQWEASYRAWDARADRAAGRCMKRRCIGSMRERWHQLCAVAHSWELPAIQALQRSAERNHEFVVDVSPPTTEVLCKWCAKAEHPGGFQKRERLQHKKSFAANMQDVVGCELADLADHEAGCRRFGALAC